MSNEDIKDALYEAAARILRAQKSTATAEQKAEADELIRDLKLMFGQAFIRLLQTLTDRLEVSSHPDLIALHRKLKGRSP